MEIVIELAEEDYNDITLTGENTINLGVLLALRKAVRNGTPLPEHHGRLIECEPIYDKLIRSYRADKKDYPEIGKDYRVGLSNAIDLLIKAPTIIEESDKNEDSN